MSEFLIGIIRNAPEQAERIQRFAEGLGFEFTPGILYEEPFFAQTLNKTDMVFELTIDGVAEKILCPDWCQYNGRFLTPPFMERLRSLQAIGRYILQFSPRFDLFIGESGCEWSNFTHRTVGVADMADCLQAEYQRCGDVPDIHLSVTR